MSLCCATGCSQGMGRCKGFVCCAGLDWLLMNHLPPAVATMSLTVPVGLWSQVLDTAVTKLIEQAKVYPLPDHM